MVRKIKLIPESEVWVTGADDPNGVIVIPKADFEAANKRGCEGMRLADWQQVYPNATYRSANDDQVVAEYLNVYYGNNQRLK